MLIQADNLNTGLPQIILALITSNLQRAGHLSRLVVLLSSTEGIASGLKLDSVIMTDNLVTVLENEIYSILGTLPNMQLIDTSLRFSLDL